MTKFMHRIVATAALTAAPVLIALGAAAAGHADTGTISPGPSFNAPVEQQMTPWQRAWTGPDAWANRRHQHRYHHYYG